MRVTNTMMTSRMLLNIQRNMQYMDELNNQIASTKRIQVPSDDPIAAARALKFRTSVSETEQYLRNVGQGLSWMSATDTAFLNATDIITRMRELLVEGSTGTNIYDDRAAIAENIQQLMDQLGKEMNATYAGRYIFSGYRTDQPPVFEKDNDKSYNITQYFDGSDIETTKVVHKITNSTYGNADEAIANDVYLIKLAYTDMSNIDITITTNGSSLTPTIVSKSLADDADAYAPDPDSINFIAETGELVLGENIFKAMQAGNMTVSYDKTGFLEGDLNPLVYFNCKEYEGDAPVGSFSFTVPTGLTDQNGQPLEDDNLTVAGCTGNFLDHQSIYTRVDNLRDMQPDQYHYDPATRVLTIGSDLVQLGLTGSPPGIDVFNGESFVLHTDISQYTENLAVISNEYNMDDQYMKYEFGVNSRIVVNSLAKDVYTDKMYADLRNFLSFVKGVEISDENQVLNKYTDLLKAEREASLLADPDAAVMTDDEIATEAQRLTTEQLTREKQEAETALQDRFNNMLGLIDKHLQTVSVQETDLGARMNRLQLIETRLKSDLINYKKMLSENEDTNMVDAAIELSVAEAAYNASLMVGASIIQMTLADYIR